MKLTQDEIEDRLEEIDQETAELEEILNERDAGDGVEYAIEEGLIAFEEEDGEYYFYPTEGAHHWELEELDAEKV